MLVAGGGGLALFLVPFSFSTRYTYSRPVLGAPHGLHAAHGLPVHEPGVTSPSERGAHLGAAGLLAVVAFSWRHEMHSGDW